MTVQEQTSPEAATEGAVEYEVSDGIATIWLNRPRVKNCFNWEQLTTFGAALERAEEDDDARVVVVRGRGHTFCAGADLNMLDSEFLEDVERTRSRSPRYRRGRSTARSTSQSPRSRPLRATRSPAASSCRSRATS